MDIDAILNLENEYLKWENKVMNEDKVIIYGAGKIACSLLKRLRKRGVEIIGIVDKDYDKAVDFGKKNAISALKKSDLNAEALKGENVQIVVASVSYRNEIKKELHSYFSEEQIKIFEFVPQISGELAIEEYREFLIHNKRKINLFEKCLADKQSRDVLENIIMGRYCYNFDYFKKVQSFPLTYFPDDIIRLTNDEVFVDGGAYIGDTYEEFITKCKNGGGLCTLLWI